MDNQYGRRQSDNIGGAMTEQYITICKTEFETIREKVGRIETKIFNGFDAKITDTAKTVDNIQKEVKGLQRLILSMLFAVIAGSFSIIMALLYG